MPSRLCLLDEHKRQAQRSGNHCRAGGHIAATRPFAAKVRQAKSHGKLWPNAESDNAPSGFSEERRNAWFDARLAPALPPGSSNTPPKFMASRRWSHARSRDRSIAPLTPRSTSARSRSRRCWSATASSSETVSRPLLEHLAPSRGVVRHHGDRCHLPYGQSPPFPRADRLDHQPCGRPHRDDRPHLHSDPGEDRRQAAERGALRRAHRQGAHAADHAEERDRLRGLDRAGGRQIQMEGL